MDDKVRISTEYIKLDQLLKFSGAVSIGSEAKAIISEGKVCLMRGKKLRPGDIVTINGNNIVIE